MSDLFRITRTDADDAETPSLYRSVNEFPNLEHVDGAELSSSEGDYVRKAIEYLDATPTATGCEFPGLRIKRA